MKYVLLIYAAPDAWPPDEHALALAESIQLCWELDAQGQYLAAAPLHPPETAKCVKVRNGQTIVSDGPFAETKEQLGGYFLIEAANLDEAIAIAARVPGARRGTAEIRPCGPLV
ncbi:YCII-related domain protein [Lignipirellula cremea]|uniref:YCII-related domain protein n=2 Tax=Lignipirellula cremea TaxID=2528010 RepID=A0A518DY58_9BACT|nr:YCII-related domain protein [Lignipirellula cremea]